MESTYIPGKDEWTEWQWALFAALGIVNGKDLDMPAEARRELADVLGDMAGAFESMARLVGAAAGRMA